MEFCLTTLKEHARASLILRITATLWLILITSSGFAAQNTSQTNAPTILSQYTKLLEQYYHQAISKSAPLAAKDISSLFHQTQSAFKVQDEVQGITLILANRTLINENIDSMYTAYFISQLLEKDMVASAESIAQYVFSEADFETRSKIHYVLAAHYFKHNDFALTREHLSGIDDREALSITEQDYATLMYGIIVQESKRHRDAINIYKKIDQSSYYYAIAQLNIAVANIRQGWWTDSHIAIKNALSTTIPKPLSELKNRLSLVLAYSQLQNEFYRNARKSFGEIDLDSIYVDKALLGLGLSALNQKDYAGAINAFERLKKMHDKGSLAAIEAHLLVPYTYDRMGKTDKAAEGYANAITFYESKRFLLDAQLLSLDQSGDIPEDSEFRHAISPTLLRMLETAKNMVRVDHSKRQPDWRQLAANIKHTIAKEHRQTIEHYRLNIKSYTSQSQYGLAKLYDQ